jgi:hypothetical protein
MDSCLDRLRIDVGKIRVSEKAEKYPRERQQSTDRLGNPSPEFIDGCAAILPA